VSHEDLDIAFHAATAAEYDRTITREYGIYHRGWVYPLLDRLAEEFPGATVLDVGCGTGVLTLALAARGFEVVAVDHSQEMLALAEEKARAAGLESNIRFVESDAGRMGFDDDSFVGATAQGVLHHLADPIATVREIARLVQPGGFLFVSEPCSERTALSRIAGTLFRLLGIVRRSVGFSPRVVDPETVERPLRSQDLFDGMRQVGLDYRATYAVHIPQLHRIVPDRIRLPLIKALSLTWGDRHGDLVFVLARKPDVDD